MAQQHNKAASHQHLKADEADNRQRRLLRLLFFMVLSIWTLAALAAPIIVFCLTKNPLSFSLFSTLAPPVILWCLFAKYLFPMDEKTFEIKRLRIERTNKGIKFAPGDNKRETGN